MTTKDSAPVAAAETVEVTLDGESRTLRTFPRLSPAAFQHPDDKDASNALHAVPLCRSYSEPSTGATSISQFEWSTSPITFVSVGARERSFTLAFCKQLAFSICR